MITGHEEKSNNPSDGSLAGSTSSESSDEVAELDRFAYDVTHNWFRRHPNPILEYKGLPLGELLRPRLANKVSRALRREVDPRAFNFEASLLLRSRDLRTRGWGDYPKNWGSEMILRKAKRSAASAGRRLTLKAFRLKTGKRLVATPVDRSMSPGLMAALNRSRSARFLPFSLGGRLQIRPEDYRIGPLGRLFSFGYPPPPRRLPVGQAEAIHRAVVEGLEAEGIHLIDSDADTLHLEIVRELHRIDSVEYRLDHYPIDGLFLQGDDSAAGVAFVLAARKRGIPSLCIQHGLDCEHGFHREAYADAFAVWGPERISRYRRQSTHQPYPLEIVGNPEYASLRRPQTMDCEGGYWLWVTRPHSPIKCHSPSRHPKEGVLIFEAFLRCIRAHTDQRLLIKPHPADIVEEYSRRISAEGMEHRITLVDGPLNRWIPGASLVISEDSTAGMDAMMFAKPLVHVHFAKCDPVLPFVEYGAALPAFSAPMLEEALAEGAALTPSSLTAMHEGQGAFLEDFAGPLDGRQLERVTAFVDRVLGS